MTFAAQLVERVERLQSRLLVGIDPHEDRLPAELRTLDVQRALTQFGHGVVEAVTDSAVAVKVQIAFFERHGVPGWMALQGVLEYAHGRGVPVVLDAKRGDIGSTAAAYADAFLGERPDTPGPHVSALTVNPYLGCDSLEPFVQRAVEHGKGLFVLARTSNPGGADFQEQLVSGSGEREPLYLRVARKVGALNEGFVHRSGYGPVGLVAGATFPEQLASVRASSPHSWLLVPGIGAQGGKAEDLAGAFDSAGYGVLPTASRSITFAEPQRNETWTEAVARSAIEHRDSIETALSRKV